MYKEKLNKYWELIDWWRKAESNTILYKYEEEKIWYLMSNLIPNFFLNKCIYIKNDEYVEFRKAEADEKIIEKKNYDNVQKCNFWVKTDTTDMLNYEIKGIRIKPDEPKYKIGDYVVINQNKIKKITRVNKHSHSIDFTRYKKDELRLWTVEDASANEWVHYRHKNDDIYITCGIGYFIAFVESDINDNYIVAPAIGQTPEELGF